MIDDKDFKKNLQLLEKRFSQLPPLIPNQNSQELEFCKTRAGELNLKQEIHGKQQPLYSNYNIAKEGEKWFASLDLEKVDNLAVYGLGLGHYYYAAKQWLHEKPNRHLIFLEEDPYILRAFLQTPHAKELLEDRHLMISFLEDSHSLNQNLQMLCWMFLGQMFKVTALDFYARSRFPRYSEIAKRLMVESLNIERLKTEFTHYSRPFFRSFYSNLETITNSHRGNALFGKFKNVPAIISGAGPSLNKNLSTLKTLRDKALLFVGGSALGAFSNKGLKPHFSAGVDPHPFQKKLINNCTPIETPFIYCSRYCPAALEAFDNPKIYIQSAGGFEVESWFEKSIGMGSSYYKGGEYFDGGYNVVNFATSVAKEWGCNPIIFVGLDLAFSDNKLHAEGVLEWEGRNAFEEKSFKPLMEEKNKMRVERKDIYGNPILTKSLWLNEAAWIENFVEKNRNVKIINATEGGLGIPNVENLTLKEVEEKFLKKSYNLDGMIHQELQATLPAKESEEIAQETLKKFKESFKRCLENSEESLRKIKSIRKKCEKGKLLDLKQHQEINSLFEEKSTGELAFEEILSSISFAQKQISEQKRYHIELDESLRTQRERDLKFLDSYDEKIHFYRNAAKAHLELIDESNLQRDYSS